MPSILRLIICTWLLLWTFSAQGQFIDLSSASVYLPSGDQPRLNTVVRVLLEEVNKRTDIELPVVDDEFTITKNAEGALQYSINPDLGPDAITSGIL